MKLIFYSTKFIILVYFIGSIIILVIFHYSRKLDHVGYRGQSEV